VSYNLYHSTKELSTIIICTGFDDGRKKGEFRNEEKKKENSKTNPNSLFKISCETISWIASARRTLRFDGGFMIMRKS